MTRKKNKRNLVILLVLILVPLLFAAGYMISTGAAGKLVQQWFENGETTTPDGETDPETPGEPDGETPGEEPAEDEPDVKPDEPQQTDKEDPAGPQPGAEDPEEAPIIYVGQVLTIPVAGGGTGYPVSKVVTSGAPASRSKQIALTFDSGWEYTQTIPLLNVLDQYGIKATFFPRALWLKDHQDLGREIARRGHTMGNHSLTHPHMNDMSPAAIREELRKSTQIIKDVCGVQPYLFRPPYGEYNNQLLTILGEEGYPYTIMWTIDTLDWNAGNTMTVGGKKTYIDLDIIVDRVLANSDANKNNGIVLMHIGGETAGHLTVPALPRIIEGLRSQGYSFTTIDKMLPPPAAGGQTTHTVKSGDTLYSISRRYAITVQQLIDANNLR